MDTGCQAPCFCSEIDCIKGLFLLSIQIIGTSKTTIVIPKFTIIQRMRSCVMA